MTEPTITLGREEVRERKNEAHQEGRFQAYRVWEELEARIRDEERQRRRRDERHRARIADQATALLLKKREAEDVRWEARLVANLFVRSSATSAELASAFEDPPTGLSQYLARLKRLDMIETTGEKRATPSGGYAAVLRCTWTPNGGVDDA